MPHVYILTNYTKTVLYIGVTRSLEQRIQTHKLGSDSRFCKKYNCNRLIYYEEFDRMDDAIRREKQLKGWRRSKKDQLVLTMNPNRIDLSWNWLQ